MHAGTVILLVAAAIAVLLLWQFRTHWIYLCRISLLGLLFLALLPISAVSIARGLLIGVFDLDAAGSFAVGFLLFFVAWAIVATSELVLQLADARLGVKVPPFGNGVYILRAVLIILACAINFVVVVTATEGPRFEVACGLALGFAAAIILFVIIQIWEARANRLLDFSKGRTPRLLLRWIWLQLFKPRVKRPSSVTTPDGGFDIEIGRQKIVVPRWLGRGYLHQTQRGASLLPDHLRATLALLVFGAIYVFFGVLEITLPALSYLLLLLVIFIWLVSGLSFFLDSYRIPTLVPIIALVWLSSRFQNSDHFYRVWPISPVPEFDTGSGEVLAQAADDKQPVVLIAAAGGGIQAAAWTARVLTGLEEILDEMKPGAFARSIRVFSGVSGGSVGIMFYVHATYPLKATGPAAVERRQKIVEVAEASSLSQAVRGLAYSDLWRAIFPPFVTDIYDDRSERLEQAWIDNDVQQFHWADETSLGNATLSQWRRDLANHKRPAIIFNATVVETGQRFTISTVRFGVRDLAQGQSDFTDSCPDIDISIPTSVRLSATFPVVSPAARPALARNATSKERTETGRRVPNLHLVDGGYFDNSGLVALSNWLDSALQDLMQKEPRKVPEKILVIQILPFPEPASENAKAPAGHFLEILSPLQTLMSVRQQVQTGLTQRDFAFVSTRWKLEAFNPDSPARIRPIEIQLVNIVYQGDEDERNTPLSWHLRKGEQDAIEKSWDRFKSNSNLEVIKKFFAEDPVH